MTLGNQLPKLVWELKYSWLDESKNLGDKTTKINNIWKGLVSHAEKLRDFIAKKKQRINHVKDFSCVCCFMDKNTPKMSDDDINDGSE